MSRFEHTAAVVRRQASHRLKLLATELWAAGDDDLVTVSELRCTEAGCPPLETVIVLFPHGGTPRQIKIHRPLLEVTDGDVRRAMAVPDHGP